MSSVPKSPSEVSPYVGLKPYTEEYSEYLFGRDDDVRVIISNLNAIPLTILYGESGVGKSSVLLAKVVPQLRQTPDIAVVLFRNWQSENLVPDLKREVLRAVSERLTAGPDDAKRAVRDRLVKEKQSAIALPND